MSFFLLCQEHNPCIKSGVSMVQIQVDSFLQENNHKKNFKRHDWWMRCYLTCNHIWDSTFVFIPLRDRERPMEALCTCQCASFFVGLVALQLLRPCFVFIRSCLPSYNFSIFLSALGSPTVSRIMQNTEGKRNHSFLVEEHILCE